MKHVTGAVSCTHCNSTFFPDDKNRWDGERCLSCGGPLIID
jgi:rRNA maturation endonuclease Nob1